jgi:hypothetical protein
MMQGDFTHFNEAGGAYMARKVLHALFDDFQRWMKDHPSAGCATEPLAP